MKSRGVVTLVNMSRWVYAMLRDFKGDQCFAKFGGPPPLGVFDTINGVKVEFCCQ